MASQSLAEVVLQQVEVIEREVYSLARKIPGASPESVTVVVKALAALETKAKSRMMDSEYEAWRRGKNARLDAARAATVSG